jgi:hypothetical protein
MQSSTRNPELEAMTAMELIAKMFGRSEAVDINKTTPINIYIRENCHGQRLQTP